MQNKKMGNGILGRYCFGLVLAAGCLVALWGCGQPEGQTPGEEAGEAYINLPSEEADTRESVGEGEAWNPVRKGDTETRESAWEGEDKTEIVYAKLSAEGAVRKVTSEVVLHYKGQKGKLEDYSSLTDLVNQRGEEEYTRKGNSIIWDNMGEDIAYKGSGGKDLPVGVDVRYFLDEKTIAPRELAGRSGGVRIRWTYSNHTETVPFTVLFFLPLDGDVFADIRVFNGRLIDMEGQKIVIGMAFPGWKERLPLQESKLTRDLKPEDYIEIEARVKDFEMGSAISLVSPEILEEMDESMLKELEELPEDCDRIRDAFKGLVRGGDKLCEGSRNFRAGLEEYSQGVEGLERGTETLRDGLKSLNDQKGKVREGAAALQSGLAELEQAMTMLASVSGGDMIAMQMAPAVRNLREGSERLTAGITEFNSGVERAYLGSVELADGMGELRKGGESLREGARSLEEGNKKLVEGIKTFRRETEKKLEEVAGESLAELAEGLREMKEAGEKYETYSGIKEGQKGKVTFWLETDKIVY